MCRNTLIETLQREKGGKQHDGAAKSFGSPCCPGGGGRRFAPVDTAVAHHKLNTEQKLSFVRLVARRRAFLCGEKGGDMDEVEKLERLNTLKTCECCISRIF